VIQYSDGNCVFGTGPIRPIVNLPAGVLKMRIRQRQMEFTRVFLRFADRIEQWDLDDTPEGWSLLVCVASNKTSVTSVSSCKE
jgi:hypothetical protein